MGDYTNPLESAPILIPILIRSHPPPLLSHHHPAPPPAPPIPLLLLLLLFNLSEFLQRHHHLHLSPRQHHHVWGRCLDKDSGSGFWNKLGAGLRGGLSGRTSYGLHLGYGLGARPGGSSSEWTQNGLYLRYRLGAGPGGSLSGRTSNSRYLGCGRDWLGMRRLNWVGRGGKGSGSGSKGRGAIGSVIWDCCSSKFCISLTCRSMKSRACRKSAKFHDWTKL